jgi:hypothetical protein
VRDGENLGLVEQARRPLRLMRCVSLSSAGIGRCSQYGCGRLLSFSALSAAAFLEGSTCAAARLVLVVVVLLTSVIP